ncbi:unnamed protein product [Durusdinium trenchii]|uniref:Alpha/beta hydrolase fold-3 domain-containing protein n=1 Tax=Durusdinium trenchii TaxID=1381693 RepID=A0ABP0PFX1_9DINO
MQPKSGRRGGSSMLLLVLLATSCLLGSAKPSRGRPRTVRSVLLASDLAGRTEPEECKLSGHKDLHLLSPATACCYGKIVKNTSCCMDQQIAPGVTRKTLQRKGMHWNCTEENCWDTVQGPRGRDSFWLPEGATCSTPRTLYTHGGSWMYGSPDTDSYAQLGSRLAKVTGTVVMLTDYPLVPAGNYSSILQWAIDALQWLSLNGPFEGCDEEHGAKRVPLFVGGDSSGGGTTMSLVLTLAKRPQLLGQKLAGAFFFSPWTNLMCNTPEYYSNAFSKIQGSGKFQDDSKLTMYTGDILFQEVTPENADAFNGNAVDYLGGDFELQTDPIASPFFAQPADFAGSLPPLYFAVGASESILGDSVRVAQHAAQGGCDVILEVYHGMWHVFPMYSEGCGLGEPLWAGAYAINQTGLFVRHIHEQGRLPYKLKVEGPNGGPPESSILAKFWQPSVSKVPFFRYLYDPNVRHFSKVGELLPNRDATYSYKDIMKDLAKQSPWIVLPSLTGAAVTIFVMGFCLGGLTEFGGERAVRRFAHGGGWCTGFAGGRVGWKFSAAGQYSLHYKGLITIY